MSWKRANFDLQADRVTDGGISRKCQQLTVVGDLPSAGESVELEPYHC